MRSQNPITDTVTLVKALLTPDYKRNRTATLFAALNVADGTVISMCDDRHRH